MRVTLVSISAIVLVAAMGVAAWYLLQPPKAITICEEVLTSSLKSPSSYKRIECAVSGYPIDKANFAYTYMNSYFVKKLVDSFPKILESEQKSAKIIADSKGYNAEMITAEISYDSANSYGAILRGKYLCAFIDQFGEGKVDKIYLAVAGELPN
ncbi:MAG TPA: hypothetical protein VIJ42_01120 [Stellaceae bacterium]